MEESGHEDEPNETAESESEHMSVENEDGFYESMENEPQDDTLLVILSILNHFLSYCK